MKEWGVKKLGEVCSFFNGQAHEKCIDENGKYKLINSKFVSSEGETFKRTDKALSPLFANDIVMVMSDVPNGKTLAKCFIVDEDDTYTLNQRVCVIRSKNFDTRFLYYQLNRNKCLLSFDNGENQSNLRKDDILNCELLLPPLPEQQRIVGILDEAFAAIAKAKANAEQNLKNAKELFENYLQSVFENKGEGWEEKTLKELTTILGDGLHGTPKYTIEGDYYFINGNNLTDGVIEFKENTKRVSIDEYYKYKKNLTSRTVLVSINGTLGNVAFYNGEKIILGKSACYFNLKENVDRVFIKYVLSSPYFFKYAHKEATGATIKNVSLKTMREFKVPIPPLKEQQTIVQKLDVLLTETKKLETIYQQKINDLEELKKSILQKAFSGELKTSKEVAA
ncbi:MAG TPA: restriction endonuclease subunit S [Nitrosomonas sp.]|nr:restriction endonuclease subunit S [Nitrosomonas sp.]